MIYYVKDANNKVVLKDTDLQRLQVSIYYCYPQFQDLSILETDNPEEAEYTYEDTAGLE